MIDLYGIAFAGFMGVGVIPAGAGVHRAGKHERSRENKRPVDPGYGDRPVFQRLAQ